jgi:hypothetical protein
LQLQAARSLTRPQFDFLSTYRINAFGDNLLGQNDNDGVTSQGLSSAYETLTQGDQTAWNLGFVGSIPIGFRSARAQVHNYELRLARARELLAAQEQDLAQDLATAFQDLAVKYVTAQSNQNRRRSAKSRVDILEKQREGGVLKADLVLRSQASLAEAERDFYQSLSDYSVAIANLHFTKGTLLDYNNVQLAEGPWLPEAQDEALRRAWARSHAFKNPLLKTEPTEFAIPGRGPGIEWETENGSTSLDTDGSTDYEDDSATVPPAPDGEPLPEPPKNDAAVGADEDSIDASGPGLLPDDVTALGGPGHVEQIGFQSENSAGPVKNPADGRGSVSADFQTTEAANPESEESNPFVQELFETPVEGQLSDPRHNVPAKTNAIQPAESNPFIQRESATRSDEELSDHNDAAPAKDVASEPVKSNPFSQQQTSTLGEDRPEAQERNNQAKPAAPSAGRGSYQRISRNGPSEAELRLREMLSNRGGKRTHGGKTSPSGKTTHGGRTTQGGRTTYGGRNPQQYNGDLEQLGYRQKRERLHSQEPSHQAEPGNSTLLKPSQR